MILEDNWRQRTLEDLENDVWEESIHTTGVILTCLKLRQKPLNNFGTEDLRLMIGQNLGLTYLIPLAIEILQKDILAEGDYYEGDLLINVLRSNKAYWKDARENWTLICELFNQNNQRLEEFDTLEEIREEWFMFFTEFEKINMEEAYSKPQQVE